MDLDNFPIHLQLHTSSPTWHKNHHIETDRLLFLAPIIVTGPETVLEPDPEPDVNRVFAKLGFGCGIICGAGCSDPTAPTSTLFPLPALDSA